MSTVYTGVGTGAIHTTATIPSDGDDVDAVSVNTVFQPSTDNWAHAALAYPDLYSGGSYTGAPYNTASLTIDTGGWIINGPITISGHELYLPATTGAALVAQSSTSATTLVQLSITVQNQSVLTVTNAASTGASVVSIVAGGGAPALTVDAGILSRIGSADVPNGATSWRALRGGLGPSVTSSIVGEAQEVLHIPDALAASIVYNLTTPVGGVGVEFTITGFMGAGAAVAIKYVGLVVPGTAGVFNIAAGRNQTCTLIYDPTEQGWNCKAVVV